MHVYLTKKKNTNILPRYYLYPILSYMRVPFWSSDWKARVERRRNCLHGTQWVRSFDVNSVWVNLSYKKSISQITEIWVTIYIGSKPPQLLCFQNLATKRTSPTTGTNEIIEIPHFNHLGDCKNLINHCRFNVNVLQEHDQRETATYDEAGQLHARWHFIKCKRLDKYIWRLLQLVASNQQKGISISWDLGLGWAKWL